MSKSRWFLKACFVVFVFIAGATILVSQSANTKHDSQSGGFFMAVASGKWGCPEPIAPGSVDPSWYLLPVHLFRIAGKQPASPLGEIPPYPVASVIDPWGVVFNQKGELFVGNRYCNQLDLGNIARFIFDNAGNPIPNGVIQDDSLQFVHSLAFSNKKELFACNYFAGTISRFKFDSAGNAVPNGIINEMAVGLAFSKDGELFTVGAGYNEVRRFVFDSVTGEAIPNGSFWESSPPTVPAGSFSIAFSPMGELFLSSPYLSSIIRWKFDKLGEPIYNGIFHLDEPPACLAFSPTGELFVGVQKTWDSAEILRFGFNNERDPILIERFPVSWAAGQLAIFPPVY